MQKLLTVIAVLILFCLAPFARAGCIVGDKVSVNKSLHFSGLAITDIVITDLSQSEAWGTGVAVGLGAYREGWKIAHRSEGYNCEWMSMVYDAAGILFGHWVIGKAHILVAPQPHGALVLVSHPL